MGTAPIVRDLLVFGYILCTIPSFISQIGNRLTPLQENQVDHTLNHLSPSVSALLVAVQQAPDTSVVMVDPSLPYDVLIPLTGKVTFTGHPIHTLYPQTKDALRLAFFSGSMSRNEAKNFLEAHAIRYVVWDKKRPVLPMIETLFTLRYQNDLGILYERK